MWLGSLILQRPKKRKVDYRRRALSANKRQCIMRFSSSYPRSCAARRKGEDAATMIVTTFAMRHIVGRLRVSLVNMEVRRD